MKRTILSNLASAALLSVAAGMALLTAGPAQSQTNCGFGSGTCGVIVWESGTDISKAKGKLRARGQGAGRAKSTSGTNLRMSQAPAGGSSEFDSQIDSMMNNNVILPRKSKKSQNLRAKGK